MNKKIIIVLVILGVLLIAVGGIFYFKDNKSNSKEINIGTIDNGKICNYKKIIYIDTTYAYFVPCNYDYILSIDGKKYNLEEQLKNNKVSIDEVVKLIEVEKKEKLDLAFDFQISNNCEPLQHRDKIWSYCFDEIKISVNGSEKELLRETLIDSSTINPNDLVAYILFDGVKKDSYNGHNVYDSYGFRVLECKDRLIMSYSNIEYQYDLCQY